MIFFFSFYKHWGCDHNYRHMHFHINVNNIHTHTHTHTHTVLKETAAQTLMFMHAHTDGRTYVRTCTIWDTHTYNCKNKVLWMYSAIQHPWDITHLLRHRIYIRTPKFTNTHTHTYKNTHKHTLLETSIKGRELEIK